jgi:2,4-dienoyl-CoA reductase-like NADH-dependent reductase (Old Yellow Enzyme family)/NADPH-dependent 2,4-dienoyl-CoA reductase/sulfur reductase-like enzyme
MHLSKLPGRRGPVVLHPNYPNLFSPIRIGNFIAANRICHVPTDISSGNADGSVNQRVITYHQQIAKGGCGFIIVGASTPDRATGRPTVTCLSVDEDPMIPGLAELAEGMHRHGARCAVQIQHPGRQAAWPRKGLISASDQIVELPGSAGHEVVYAEEEAKGKSIRAMTVDEIYELVEKFAEAAWRVQQAGFDAVELHAAHGYLIAQFMSPYVNRRNDRFGGSFLNRMRIVLEILNRIRHKCGAEYPVGIRYSGEEWIDGGRTIDETVQAASLFVQHGAAFLDISAGIFEAPGSVMDPMYYPQGWNTYTAEAVKKHVAVPVITSHSLRSPSYCEQILAEGKADLVGLSRQMIADPYWANKAFAHRPQEIRKCISCLVGCWQESLMIKRHMRCSINPAVGDERFIDFEPASQRFRVAVVGGGPAGMEAARIATLRGHRVTLFEKTNELGGAILYCCSVSGKSKMRWYADWLRRQMQNLAVEVVYGATPGVDVLRGFDAVILATGGRVRRPDIPGIGSDLVLTFEDVLRCDVKHCEFRCDGRVAPKATGATVLVWGDHFAAADTAEKLAGDGKKVYVVTERPEFAQWMEPCHRDVMFKRFAGGNGEGLRDKTFEHPVTVFTGTTVVAVGPDGTVSLMDNRFGRRDLKVDHVVLAAVDCNDQAADPSSLAVALREAGVLTFEIGDQKKVRNLRAAVQEGANAGLTLDAGLRLNANGVCISRHPTEVNLSARPTATVELTAQEVTK